MDLENYEGKRDYYYFDEVVSFQMVTNIMFLFGSALDYKIQKYFYGVLFESEST